MAKNRSKIVGKNWKEYIHDEKMLLLSYPNTTLQVIHALVLSHLHFCSSIWSSAAYKELHKLQLVQSGAARLALRCSRRKNRPNAC